MVRLLNEQDQLAVARGLRDGCREAWGRLYDAYSADVWRYVARLLGPRPGAVADVVQEVFLAAAVAARRFDAERGNLWSWLAGIAHHKVVAHWRQANRADRVKAMAQAGAAEIRHWFDRQISDEPKRSDGAASIRVLASGAGSDGAAGAGGLAAFDLADLVRSVLAELPADYAALLTAKYLDYRALADLADESGVTVDAVKSKLARARREFRSKFEFLTKEPTRSAPH